MNNRDFETLQTREDEFLQTMSDLVSRVEKQPLNTVSIVIYLVKTAFNIDARLRALTRIARTLSRERL